MGAMIISRGEKGRSKGKREMEEGRGVEKGRKGQGTK